MKRNDYLSLWMQIAAGTMQANTLLCGIVTGSEQCLLRLAALSFENDVMKRLAAPLSDHTDVE